MAKDKRNKRSLFPHLSFAVKAGIYALIACFSGLSLWSFHSAQPCSQNWIGIIGWSLSAFLTYALGASAFLVPLYFLWLAILHVKKTPPPLLFKQAMAGGAIPLCLSMLLSMNSPTCHVPLSLKSRLPQVILRGETPVSYLGGIPFYIAYTGQPLCLKHLIGSVGTGLIFSSLLLFSVFYLCGGIDLAKKKVLQKFIREKFRAYWHILKNALKKIYDARHYRPKPSIGVVTKKKELTNELFPTVAQLQITSPSNLQKQLPNVGKTVPLSRQPSALFGEAKEELPQYHLLSKEEKVQPKTLEEELEKKAQLLQQTLFSFGIEADIGHICSGPTLVAFEVLPRSGVKVQKIKALENDIALNLQASSIRIIAPIPGKAAVGIEIPTPYPQPVNFRDLLEEYQKQKHKLQVPLLLGKKANGDIFWADLATMPHLIIAGTTGSGKSVCINTIVMSLIMTTLPSDIKLVIIDPKKVELTGYSQLPHMLTPVITESKEAHNALVWLVKEMETRYEMLRFLGLRNIQAFNNRSRASEIEASYDKEIPEKLPFIVGIIDELSDLLLSSSQDIETPIIRLAQMARAVGIHLILATQRPSRDVITGLIKANFPSRIAFKVANKVNSQIIIDEPGAESLIGNGDMLVVSPASFGAVRAQGAYICDEDINKVIRDLCSRFPTKYVIPSFDTYQDFSDDMGEDRDPLFNQAKMLILQTGNASTTFLQRKLKVGYARAASLIDQLEEAGILGPSEGAKPRQILIRPQQEG